jgi:hypothetical protein
VQVLSSDLLTDANDEIDPDKVTPIDSTETIPPGEWKRVFPHASVTVIAIDRK